MRMRMRMSIGLSSPEEQNSSIVIVVVVVVVAFRFSAICTLLSPIFNVRQSQYSIIVFVGMVLALVTELLIGGVSAFLVGIMITQVFTLAFQSRVGYTVLYNIRICCHHLCVCNRGGRTGLMSLIPLYDNMFKSSPHHLRLRVHRNARHPRGRVRQPLPSGPPRQDLILHVTADTNEHLLKHLECVMLLRSCRQSHWITFAPDGRKRDWRCPVDP